jgi:hypothetical protein
MRLMLTALLALLLWPALAEAKLPEGIKMDVEVGYNRFVHLGRVNPVIVTMDNQSAGLNLSGDLVVEYNGVEYGTPLELPTPSSKRFYVYVPVVDYQGSLTLRIRTKQYTDEFILTDPTVFKTMRAEDVSVVVLTRQKGSLGALNQVAVAHLFRNMYRRNVSELDTGSVFVSYYTPDQIDHSAKFFKRADVVILADIDYQQVTQELADALAQSVAGGTSVVFSLGLNGAGVAKSPLADLCPMRSTGTVQAGSLGAFGQRYGITTRGAPAVLARGTLAPDAEVLDWAGSTPAVVQTRRGGGTVTALAFDYTQAPFKANPRVAGVFLENVLPVEDTASVSNWFLHPDMVRKLLNALSEADPMEPGFVLLFLLAYILLIGPLNFLILDRFKRRTLVWSTIPLIIALFSTVGLYTGYIRRGGNNVAAYLQELHVYPQAAYSPYQTTMLVFTAERSNYQVEVDDPSAYLYPVVPEVAEGSFPGSGALQGIGSGRLDTSGKPLLRASQGKWTSRNYFFHGHRPAVGNVQAQLTAIPIENGLSDVNGTFTLDLPFALHTCRLIGPNYRVDCGTLPGQGTYDMDSLPAANTGTAPFAEDNYLAQQRQALLDMVRSSTEFGLTYRDELLLVGFTDELKPNAKYDDPHRSYVLDMVVVHLPYQLQLNAPQPAFITTRLVGGTGFELYRQGYMGFNEDPLQQRNYNLQANSTLVVEARIAGSLGPGDDRVLLHLQGLETKSENPLSDLSAYVRIEQLVAGQWVPVRLPPPASTADLRLAGADKDDPRTLQFRVTALSDHIFTLPTAELY